MQILQICDRVVWCVSQNYRMKGEATDGAFQEQCFVWEKGASVRADFELLNF